CSRHGAVAMSATRHSPVPRLRTGLWIRTAVSRAQMTTVLSALRGARLDGEHGDFMHVVYDVDRWDMGDTPAAQAAFVSNLRSVLAVEGIAYALAVGQMCIPPPLQLPNTVSVVI